MLRTAIAFICLIGVALALRTSQGSQVRKTIEVQLHLRAARATEAEIDQAFWDRANPDSKLFRAHLSHPELVELVGASDASIGAAEQFLETNGARAVKVLGTRDVVVGHVQLGSNLAAFGLTKSDFFVAEGFKKVVQLPAASKLDVISYIAVGARVGRKARVQPVSPKNAGGENVPGMVQTPDTLRSRYKVPLSPLNAPEQITQGVAEFQESEFFEDNIQVFTKFYNLSTPTIEMVGPNAKLSNDRIEGTLDLEYITAISGGAKTYWIAQNSSNLDPFHIDFTWWCDEVLSISPRPPSVVSISWGVGDFEYGLDPSVLQSDNRAFRKLGLSGISVFAASGDAGPGSREYISCSKFMPGWPASSPYVTSVGATYANGANEGEMAVSFSGGGFSDVFAAPSFQAAAVEGYLSSTAGLPNATLYNASGRGFPDVSALGTNFNSFVPLGPERFNPKGAGQWVPISGTSAASPTFAAILTRINAERAKKGQPTVGFLNPKIYQLGRVGFDVTAGQNLDKDCFSIFTIKGFPAAKGWDPVSGLGTPDYEYLLANL